jgi:hypothetical protein
MAEDLRDDYPEERVSDPRVDALIAECERQEESCRYTSASLFIWQKAARWWRSCFLVAPIVIGGIASSQVLTKFGAEWGAVIAAIFALLAGFFPSIYVALDMDMRHTEIARAANEFTNLRDRFRQAARIKSHAGYEEFQAEFEVLMDRMDAARSASPPTPRWCFESARKEIKKGRYDFDADKRDQSGDGPRPDPSNGPSH